MTSTKRKVSVVILAAGKGTRMKSDLPKVLHRLAQKPLLEHVIDAARRLSPEKICVVVGHGADHVRKALGHLAVEWVEQGEQLGTGHAVMQAMPIIPPDHTVVILYGDVPLIRDSTLGELIASADGAGLALITCRLDNPFGYGRIVRDSAGRVLEIVEEKDASIEQRAIREINAGFIAAGARNLRQWLATLENRNAKGEYYLTDVVAKAVSTGHDVATVSANDEFEILGVNSKSQLATLERQLQLRLAGELMDRGVTLRDPARLDIRGSVEVGRDVIIDVNVILEGSVVLGDRTIVGPNCVLRDVVVGSDVNIKANCVIEDARVGNACEVGPFTRIRPQTVLAEKAHIGNFVEIKKSEVGVGSKVNHLSYIGDTTIGRSVNVGAGTITCNYDGANKHRTIIGDNAFIGSDTQLVAPVEVGAGATIGAGSTITQNAPDNELTLSRVRQTTVKGWKRPVKKKSD
jgi:bifunctional UDP-N-acetylglucosamine pyrophosphorylase/glucosamine-1-phosphate N-acetyltransferase